MAETGNRNYVSTIIKMRLQTYVSIDIDTDPAMMEFVIVHKRPEKIIIHERQRMKQSCPTTIKTGQMKDDFIKNLLTIVFTAHYLRIPRIIKK